MRHSESSRGNQVGQLHLRPACANDHRSLLATTTTIMSRIRAPSPTYTTFSGISNYRQSSTASFRKPGGNVPPVPTVDGKLIAQAHFEELSRYLAEYLARGTYILIVPQTGP